jgi:hypothetical protein
MALINMNDFYLKKNDKNSIQTDSMKLRHSKMHRIASNFD